MASRADVLKGSSRIGVPQELKNYQIQPSTFTWFFGACTGFAGRLAIGSSANSPRANVFPAGEANFGQAMYDYVSVPRKRVLMGLTDRRKTAKNLVDSRKT